MCQGDCDGLENDDLGDLDSGPAAATALRVPLTITTADANPGLCSGLPDLTARPPKMILVVLLDFLSVR